MRTHALAFTALAFVAGPLVGDLAAVTPKYWIHDTAEEFRDGELEGVAVLASGSLRLAPKSDEAGEIREPYLWDAAVDPESGNLFLGSGDDGHVLRSRKGKVEIFYECAALEVLSVAVGPSGRVFAGTAPEGFLYRIEGQGEGDVLWDAEESYIWDLAFDSEGMLYAAVGSPSRIYRVDPESGEAELFHESADHHVVCLSFGPGGELLAGTEGKGLVLSIDANGNGTVLFDCPQGEVSAVIAGPDGHVWAAAAATADARDQLVQPESNGDGSGLDRPEFLFEVTPSSAGDGVLYEIDAELNARRIWESGQGAIFDLAPRPDGTVLAATGEEGGVYLVDRQGKATLLRETEAEHVVALVNHGNSNVFAATANPATVFRISVTEFVGSGTFRSSVLDAGRVSTWGRLQWEGDAGGGRVKLSARVGNTEEPDNSWSAWTNEKSVKPGESPDLSVLPKGQFMQWQARLEGGGSKSPVLRRVRASSRENNLAPVLDDVQVLPAGNRFYDDIPELRPRALYQDLGGGVKVQYQFDRGDEEYPPENRAPWSQGLRQVRWEAVDPNLDFLLFELAYRREDETRWKTFAEEVDGKLFTFNSRGVPDGRYEIRVTASDRRGNPSDERKTSAVSEPFLVDNTAPGFRDVEHRRLGEEVRITGTLSDELSDVVRVEFSLNGDDWIEAEPIDGIFDSNRESIDVKVRAKSGEEHSVILRGTDLAGNLGAERVLIKP